MLGHDAELHNNDDLYPIDVLRHFMTQKIFARHHKVANLINNANLMVIMPHEEDADFEVKFSHCDPIKAGNKSGSKSKGQIQGVTVNFNPSS